MLVVLGCLACQMAAGFFYATRALSGEVIADLGWSRTIWASGMAPMLLVSSLSQAFVGAACLRFGVRPVVVAALLCLGGSVVTFASMQSVPQYYAAMMILAVASAGVGDVSIGSVITKWFVRRRSLALGIVLAGSNLGTIAYIAAIGLTIDEVGWRSSALFVGLGGIALILPLAFAFVRDPRAGEGEVSDSAVGEREEQDSAERTKAQLRGRAEFWVLFFALFCYALVQLGLVDQFVLYLTDLGYSNQEAYGALGLAVGAGVAAKLGAGVIGQLVSPRIAFLANTGLLATSLAIVPFASHPMALTAFSLCFGLAVSSRDVFLPLVIAETFGVRSFAQAYGLMMLAFVPGGALGPVVLAETHRIFEDYRPGFAACFGLVFIANVGLGWLARRGQRAV